MIFAPLVIVAIAIVCFVSLLRSLRMTISGLPGPRPLPFFGNALSLDRSRPYDTFTRWSRVYGDVYQARLFGQAVVVLSGFEAIQETFTGARAKDFAGRPKRFYRAAFMSDDCQDIVSASPSPAWHALRRTVQREMRRFDPGLERLELLTGAIMDEMAEALSHRSAAAEEGAVDPRETVYDAVMGVNCLFLAGDKFPSDSDEMRMFRRLERHVTESMNVGGSGSELDFFPWLRFFGNATYRRLREAKRIRDVLYDWLKVRVRRDIESGRTNNGVVHGLFSALEAAAAAAAAGAASGPPRPLITATNVKLAIVNLLIGGSAATTAYLYLLINVLAQYPDAQRLVRQETDTVVGAGRRVGLDDRDSMPFARAFLLELLRFGSLSPILIPHMTLVDTAVRGHPVPAGVQVFMNVRAVHHDPVYWGDPYVFRPQRFLDASGRLLPPEHERRKRVLSFGGGPRVCPGEQLGTSRLFIALVTVVQRFVVATPDGKTDTATCDPRTFDLGLVLSPKAYKVKFIERFNFGDRETATMTNAAS